MRSQFNGRAQIRKLKIILWGNSAKHRDSACFTWVTDSVQGRSVDSPKGASSRTLEAVGYNGDMRENSE